MEMTPRERILSALRGKDTDRLPWSPFLAYYWEHLPNSERALGQIEYMKRMGADPLLRGLTQAFRVEQKNCTVSEKRSGNKIYRTFETSVGSIHTEHTYSENANSWFLTGHPVETEEDFRVLQYMTENMTVHENIREFDEQNSALGEEGLHLPVIGVHLKTSFQSLVEHWCGTENIVYALYDFPEVVKECLETMWEKDMETVKVSVKSSADGFIFWEDSSTTNISPDMFSEYTAPEINEWGRVIHESGKLLIHHACGHLKDLIPCMCRTDIDAIESMSPPPTGNIDIADAAAIMPEHIGIIGGIEPTFFRGCTVDQLCDRVTELAGAMKGRRFVLANSDSCPPDVEYEKFKIVSELVKRI